MTRVSDLVKNTHGHFRERVAWEPRVGRGGARDRVTVAPPPVPTKGRMPHCLWIMKNKYNESSVLADSTCQVWEDTFNEHHYGNILWQQVWRNDTLMAAAFGSRETLVSSIVDAISAARINITEFGIQANVSRQLWVDNINDAIYTYQSTRSGDDAVAIVDGILCLVPALAVCEVLTLSSTAVGIYAHRKAGDSLNIIKEAFSHGLDTVYLSEDGKKIKGMMDLLQTAATMEETGVPDWSYIGKILVFYAATKARSEVPVTPDDVRRDLDELQITPEMEEEYVSAIADLTFDNKTFQEVGAAVVMNKVMLTLHIVLGATSLIKGVHVWNWWRDRRLLKKAREIYNVLGNQGTSMEQFWSKTREQIINDAITVRVFRKANEETVRGGQYVLQEGEQPYVKTVVEELQAAGIQTADDQHEITYYMADNERLAITVTEQGVKYVEEKYKKTISAQQYNTYKRVVDKPPKFFKLTTKGMGLGVAIALFAISMSAVDLTQVQDTADALRNHTMLYVDNDVRTTDAIVDTLKAWHV